jgi:U3 small nucleolar RNA-associated protein 12
MQIEEKEGKFLVLTGSGDGEVKAWTLDGATLQQGILQTENGEVRNILRLSTS